MYKALIIEDEVKLREALFLLLQHTLLDKVHVIGTAEKVSEAVALIDALRPDLVFLDIQLKDGTGFEVLERCSHKKFHLIFTTAYQQHAIRAFKYSAIDYLLKPIDPEELKSAIGKIEDLQEKYTGVEQLKLLQNNLHKIPDHIGLATQEGIHILPLNEIVRCETSGSYTTFHLLNTKKIMVSKPLKHYDELLAAPNFFRIHQSHTVNLQFISTYSRDGLLILKDGTQLPVAQRKKEEFLQLILR